MTCIATSLRESLSDLAVSTAGKEPTRGPRAHYCYSSALQIGDEYAENVYFQYTL